MRTRWMWVALAAVTLAGCGAGGENDPSQLLGNWRRLDPRTRTMVSQVSFDKDGRVVLQQEGFSPAQLLYQADDATLALETTDSETAERVKSSMPYSVTEVRLVLNALTPSGSHDGIVGTWKAKFRDERLDVDGRWTVAADFEWTIQFRADQTLRFTETSSDRAPVAVEGSYQTIGPNAYEATIGDVLKTFSLADDVIGDLFVR